jgi:hypothetical protein
MDDTLRLEDLPFEVISLILRYAQPTHTNRNSADATQLPAPRHPHPRNIPLPDIPLCRIIANNNTLPRPHLPHPRPRHPIPSRTRNPRNIQPHPSECLLADSRKRRCGMAIGPDGCSPRDNCCAMGTCIQGSVPTFLDPVQTTYRYIPFCVPPNPPHSHAPHNRMHARGIMDEVHHPSSQRNCKS